MTSAWIKPNLKGVMLFLSALFVALNLLPMPSFRYSAMNYHASVSWPWPWALAAIVLAILLYTLSMRLGSGLPRQGAVRVLTGPLLIIPLGLLIAIVIGFVVYVPPEIHGDLERHLFLQGSTDLGGGCLFAGTVALYVFFGFTSAWHLALSLKEFPGPSSFGRALLTSLWTLKFHILFFIVAGTTCWNYDARVAPNDFRNLFLFAALVYALSILWIVALRNVHLPLSARLALAPLFTVLWLILGSDGNTARAGQLVQAGQDPQPIVRSVRHGIMLSWHGRCDSALGDIGNKP
jgi:hypothetical protein